MRLINKMATSLSAIALCCFTSITSAGPILSQPTITKPATAITAQPTLGNNEAYILVDIGATGPLKSSVSGLAFQNMDNGKSIKLSGKSGLQLVKIPAGTYNPSKLLLGKNANKGKSLDNFSKSAGIHIEPGTVTYIGSWNMRYGQSIKVNGVSSTVKNVGYNLKFDGSSLQSFAKDNTWLKSMPLRISHVNGNQIKAKWDEKSGS